MHTLPEAQKINELARSVFARDGYHMPLVILFKRDKNYLLPIGPMMRNQGSKEALVGVIKKTIQDFGISGVVLITEAWMALVEQSDGETLGEIRSGKRVSDLETKKEVLMVRAESDDGLNVTFMNQIERDADGKPSLKDPEIMTSQMGGRFGGFFE